jgi:hypothetical protein
MLTRNDVIYGGVGIGNLDFHLLSTALHNRCHRAGNSPLHDPSDSLHQDNH